MISPIKNVIPNDDYETYTCSIYVSRYIVFKINPFEILTDQTLSDASISTFATCKGYQYIAITGLPAHPLFDLKHVLVIDHEKESPKIWEHKFDNHVLSLKLTNCLVAIAFYNKVEVWDYRANQQVSTLQSAINVHAPISISNDFHFLATTGTNSSDISLLDLENQDHQNLKHADGMVSFLVFSRDSSLLGSASCIGSLLKIFNTDTRECVAKIKRAAIANTLYSFDFSPDCSYIALWTKKNFLIFYSLQKIGPSAPTIKQGNKIEVNDIGASTISWFDQSQIAIISIDGHGIIVTIDNDCKEIGRQKITFIQRILLDNDPFFK